jgi:hypothetical protein
VNAIVTPGAWPDDAPLFARAANWDKAEQFADMTPERLAEIARTDGIELATALLFDRTCRAPANTEFAKRVHAFTPAVGAQADVIGVVPGAFHGQHKHTGADGLRIVETVRGLAPRVEIIPVQSFGRLEQNARTILDWIAAQRGQRVVLASLSKGGADVKRALAAPGAGEAFAGVAAWISFSGIVQGTPLIAWLRARPLRSGAFGLLLRLQGHRTAVLDELRRASDAPLAHWPPLPSHLRVVHVAGYPLRWHLRHRWAPRGYERLAPLGPNDGGGILLGDLARLPGVVFPIWGADHYLQPSWDATPLLRAIVAAASAPDDPHQASRSEM